MGHWIGIRNTVDVVRGSAGLWSLLCIHRDEGPGKSMGKEMYNLGFKGLSDKMILYTRWEVLHQVMGIPVQGYGWQLQLQMGRLDSWAGTRFMCIHTPSINGLCFLRCMTCRFEEENGKKVLVDDVCCRSM